MENPAASHGSLLFFFVICMLAGSDSVSSRRNNKCGENTGSESILNNVGLIMDFKIPVGGTTANVSMSLALLSDFCALHPKYRTKLRLHAKDAEDVTAATSAVISLVKKVGVITIIGQQWTSQAPIMVRIGRKAHFPIIPFFAASPNLSAQNDYSQVKAITAIIQGFKWEEIIIIFEDTEYGNGIIPHLTDSFNEAGIQVPYKKAIPIYAKDFYIIRDLNKLRNMESKVFLVHTRSTVLGSRIFRLADKAGMMSEGYAWLITDGLSNSLHEMDPMVIESMEGVLGFRPLHFPKSKDLIINFKIRWKKNFNSEKPNTRYVRVKHGRKLLIEPKNTKFNSLIGEFRLIGRYLQPSAMELLNFVGKGERIVGYWTLDKGITRELRSTKDGGYSTSTNELKKIIWPGDVIENPLGRTTTQIKKQVGVPTSGQK